MSTKIDAAKYVLNRISDTMLWQTCINGKPLRWFYCFGTLQEYIADFDLDKCVGGFSLDYDIDIGIVYGDCPGEQIIRAFEGNGYKCSKKFLHDKTKNPLNLHFSAVDGRLEESPSVDVYFWIKKGNVWYHTYDRNHEGKEVPSKYTFKGIEFNDSMEQGFFAPQKVVERIHTKNPEGRMRITNEGIWKLDIFERDSTYKFYAPYSYGVCLDAWYDNWKYRKFNNLGESKSPLVRHVKSCSEL